MKITVTNFNKKLKRYIFFIVICFVCMLAGGCGGETIVVSEPSESVKDEKNAASENVPLEEKTESVTSADKIIVYVCGAVENPDVYELDPGARINDALEAAGGFSGDADMNMINLAEPVSDGQRVYFPVQGEDMTGDSQDMNAALETDIYGDDTSLVNINKAGVSELTQLPGIGETRAGQIVEYRETHGKFSSKEDLKNVSGIGDSTYEKLESHIIVD